jgi:hypothetical protein
MRSLILLPAMLLSLSIVSGCATPVTSSQKYPPADDLQRPAKPKISVDILTSERLHEEYNAAVEAWGDGLAAQVDRLCRFERQLGAPVTCPPAPPPGPHTPS